MALAALFPPNPHLSLALENYIINLCSPSLTSLEMNFCHTCDG